MIGTKIIDLDDPEWLIWQALERYVLVCSQEHDGCVRRQNEDELSMLWRLVVSATVDVGDEIIPLYAKNAHLACPV